MAAGRVVLMNPIGGDLRHRKHGDPGRDINNPEKAVWRGFPGVAPGRAGGVRTLH